MSVRRYDVPDDPVGSWLQRLDGTDQRVHVARIGRYRERLLGSVPADEIDVTQLGNDILAENEANLAWTHGKPAAARRRRRYE
jgi:hypothetical protein